MTDETPKDVIYVDDTPANANWIKIVQGILEPDGITLTEKGRKMQEESERLIREVESEDRT